VFYPFRLWRRTLQARQSAVIDRVAKRGDLLVDRFRFQLEFVYFGDDFRPARLGNTKIITHACFLTAADFRGRQNGPGRTMATGAPACASRNASAM
jgi:hypothetical protein